MRRLWLLAAAAVMLLAGGVDDAGARTERAAGGTRDLGASAKQKAAKPAPGPVIAVVSLARQRISVYGSDGLLAQSPVSTGTAGHRTPTGVFSVIQKNRWHRSNIYSGAPMPYMQRITWSGIALHAGIVPGYPASHGCIRLPHAFAVELWGMTRMGARVVVTGEEAVAVGIASAHLPVPKLMPADALEPMVGDEAKSAVVAVALNGGDSEKSEAEAAAPRLLNPLERAKILKQHTATEAKAKAKAAKTAVELSTQKAAEANKAIAALRAAGLAVDAARAKLETATKAVDAGKSEDAVARARTAVTAAEEKLADASKAEEEARALEAVAVPEAFAAARAAWEAENANTFAAAAAKAAERAPEPISIFVSRKAGRVYIRQAWAPIHEAPVTIRESEASIGTHSYLAVEPTDDGKALRWLSVTSPSARADDDDDDQPRSRRGRSQAAQASQATPARSLETAAGALERVEMPEETRQFIADKLWTGASLIISDQGISNETGTYTDFIVLTR